MDSAALVHPMSSTLADMCRAVLDAMRFLAAAQCMIVMMEHVVTGNTHKASGGWTFPPAGKGEG